MLSLEYDPAAHNKANGALRECVASADVAAAVPGGLRVSRLCL